MLRRVIALLLLGLSAGGFAHANGVQLSASASLEAPVQQCAAAASVDFEASGSTCAFVCPASACIASSPGHYDFGLALISPSVFLAPQVLNYLRAPDKAPPRFSSL